MYLENRVSAAFAAKAKEVAKAINMDADYLMGIMYFETAGTFSPAIQNPLSGATGLVQFMPTTAAYLGTSTAALKSMSAVQQLDYVEKYFNRGDNAKMSRATFLECYLIVFYPKANGREDSYALPFGVTSQNKIFDKDKNGYITKKEIGEVIYSMFPTLGAKDKKKS